MQLDDEVCLCFHVKRRKLENYLRVAQPKRASQLSECEGAGTGCGWCVPILEKLFADHQQPEGSALDLPSRQDHADRRQQYLREKKKPRNTRDEADS